MSEETCSRLGLIMLILSVICNFLQAHHRDVREQEAVDLGYAEYVVVADKEVEFRWIKKL